MVYKVTLLLCATISTTLAIECYSGLKVIAGTSVGTQTLQCDNSGAQCYNMTASAAVLLDVVKAGCSLWRCMLARDRCISTTFQNIPISLCCCSSDRCNVGENGVGGGQTRQSVGGWNAEPRRDGDEEHQEPQEMRRFNKDEVARKFKAMDIDDDPTHRTTGRGNRHHSTAGDEVQIP